MEVCYNIVSHNTISIDESASTTPVNPPIVNRNTNPTAHKQAALYVNQDPYNAVAAMQMRKRETLMHKALSNPVDGARTHAHIQNLKYPTNTKHIFKNNFTVNCHTILLHLH